MNINKDFIWTTLKKYNKKSIERIFLLNKNLLHLTYITILRILKIYSLRIKNELIKKVLY